MPSHRLGGSSQPPRQLPISTACAPPATCDLSGLAGGRIADLHGRRRTYLTSLSLFALLYSLSPFAPSFAAYCLIKVRLHCTKAAIHLLYHGHQASHCTLPTVHYRLYSNHCTYYGLPYTYHGHQASPCTLPTVHYRLYSNHCTYFAAHCALKFGIGLAGSSGNVAAFTLASELVSSEVVRKVGK